MKSFFKNTRMIMDRYETIQDLIWHSERETTDEEDEFLDNIQYLLAESIAKDYSDGWEHELETLGENILELSTKEKNA